MHDSRALSSRVAPARWGVEAPMIGSAASRLHSIVRTLVHEIAISSPPRRAAARGVVHDGAHGARAPLA
jgi:hypothetical protein